MTCGFMKKKYEQKIKKKKKDNSQGFTIIELIISMAIIAILTGSIVQVVRFSNTFKAVNIEANSLRDIVRTAQLYSLFSPDLENLTSEEKVCGFGVQVGGKGLIFYNYIDLTAGENIKDCENKRVYDPGESRTVENSEVVFSPKVSVVGEDIYFEVPFGEVFDKNGNNGSTLFTVTSKSKSNFKKEISVNNAGRID